METKPKPHKDTDPWLVFTLNNHSEKLNGLTDEVGKINSGLKDEIARSVLADGIHDERIARHKERIEGIEKKKPNNPSNSNSNTVTFKWILEKLALPVVMLIVGGAIALLFGA